jgi:radical SAM enzyme (TIGR01210 family)
VKFAFDTGSDSVSISCASVQKDTDLYNLWMRGQYRPPWLWSVVEVLKQCWRKGPVRVGTFDDEPQPLDGPRNCGLCDPQFTIALQTYRETLNGEAISVIQPSTCLCFEAWQKDLQHAPSYNCNGDT